MTYYRILLQSLRRSSSSAATRISSIHCHISPQNPTFLLSTTRSLAYSSYEEAAAERRRAKRRLRIEPPLQALRGHPGARPPPDPNAPRLPDSTSALVGPRLSLHNRVQSLIRAGDLDNASAVARKAVFTRTRPTVFTCNAIISAMNRFLRFEEAKALFHYFFRQYNIVPNVVSYNFLIKNYCDVGNVDEARKVYEEIIASAPFGPSHVTYQHLTKGLVDAGRIGDGVDLLREMLNKGHGADSKVYNNLIAGFLDLDNLDKANELFDELKERCLVYDGIVTATFMEWFFKKGRGKEAMEYYKSLLDRQFDMVPATCNVLLEVLLKNGKKVEAWALFDNMLDRHTPPTKQAVNSDTFNIMVNECFKLGKISEAFDVFKKVGKAPKSRPFAMDVAGYNNMIMRYSENEMMEDAEKMFAELCGKSLSPDVTTYRTLVDAYLKVDRIDEALQKYTNMVGAGLRVIPPYANKWFEILIEKGRLAECVPILEKMGEHDTKPDITTYDSVIRALCKEGKMDTSLELLKEMMRYGVGISPALKEFVYDAFGKEGRQAEVDKIMNMRWHALPPPRPKPETRFPWMARTGPSTSMPGQATSPSPPIPGQAIGPSPHTPGQVAGPTWMGTTGTPSMQKQGTGHSWMGQATGPHPPTEQTGLPPVTGQVSGPPQWSGQFSGSPQWSGQVSGTAPMAGQVSGPPQMSGQAGQFSGTPQWSREVSGAAPMAGKVSGPPRWSGQVSGTAPMAGQVSGTPQWSRQVLETAPMAGQMRVPSPLTGQVTGNHPMAGNSTGYHPMTGQETGYHPMTGQPTGPCPIAGQVEGEAHLPMEQQVAA